MGLNWMEMLAKHGIIIEDWRLNISKTVQYIICFVSPKHPSLQWKSTNNQHLPGQESRGWDTWTNLPTISKLELPCPFFKRGARLVFKGPRPLLGPIFASSGRDLTPKKKQKKQIQKSTAIKVVGSCFFFCIGGQMGTENQQFPDVFPPKGEGVAKMISYRKRFDVLTFEFCRCLTNFKDFRSFFFGSMGQHRYIYLPLWLMFY